MTNKDDPEAADEREGERLVTKASKNSAVEGKISNNGHVNVDRLLARITADAKRGDDRADGELF